MCPRPPQCPAPGLQAQLGTLVKRKTLYAVLVQLDNASAEHTAQRFGMVLNRQDAVMRLSMTYDNGKEMAHHPALTKVTGIQVYFAHPYSQWERGINENTNGLLRHDLPQGTDLNVYTRRSPRFGWMPKLSNRLLDNCHGAQTGAFDQVESARALPGLCAGGRLEAITSCPQLLSLQ